MANELIIKNGLTSKGQATLEGGLLSTGSENFTIENPVIMQGSLSVTSNIDITSDIDSTINFSSAGTNSGGGLVIPIAIPAEPVSGSTYVDLSALRLYIYDGVTWRNTPLT